MITDRTSYRPKDTFCTGLELLKKHHAKTFFATRLILPSNDHLPRSRLKMYPQIPCSFVISLLCTIQLAHSLLSDSSALSATYDYVIVGGGTAGLTLASRLSENSQIQVAVVEAGGRYEVDSGNNSVVPGYAGYGASTDPAAANDTPLIDWGFVTAPMEGLNGRSFHYTRGKTLGGSSARNYMVYVFSLEVAGTDWFMKGNLVLTDLQKLSSGYGAKLR